MTAWGCACMTSVFFWRQDIILNLEYKKEIRKGQVSGTTSQSYPEVQCCEQCPKIEKDVSISQLFTVFSIFLKPHAQKSGIPFLVSAPFPSHIVVTPPGSHLTLDLGPRIIIKDYTLNSGSRPQNNDQRLYWREQIINFKRKNYLQNSL